MQRSVTLAALCVPALCLPVLVVSPESPVRLLYTALLAGTALLVLHRAGMSWFAAGADALLLAGVAVAMTGFLWVTFFLEEVALSGFLPGGRRSPSLRLPCSRTSPRALASWHWSSVALCSALT